jgi:hypothetical protein
MKCVRQPTLRCLALLALTSGLACQHEFKTCDITQRACQEDIYYRMLSLRGDGYDPFGGLPPVTVISEADFRAILEQQQANDAKSSTDMDKAMATALALLHFSSPASTPVDGGADGGAGGDAGTGTSAIDDEVTHIYAFYDPKPKTVTVISHPSQTGSHVQEEAMITLAHELVHALQDRELDLNKSDFQTSDEYFANDAMIEGDARFYEDIFTNDVRKMLGLSSLDVTQMPDDELASDYANFDQLGSSLFAARALIYPLGAKYEATAYRSGGNAAVRHAFAKAPRRTVGLLVGADGRVPPVGTGDVCPAPVATALSPTDKTMSADQFGALLLYTFLRGWNVSHDLAFATAQTWTGDFLRVQASSDFATSAAAWRIEFSAPPPAAIAQALSATGELTVTASGRALLITVSNSATPLTWTNTSNCP